MTIFRIDDRLVHGQVIVGWVRNLSLKWLLLVDDRIDPGQKMIMGLTVPPDVDFDILNTGSARDYINEKGDQKPGMVLVKSPVEILKLLESGLEINKVHIGGLHYKHNRDQYCEYVFLSRQEVVEIREILQAGTEVTVQALPNKREIPVEKLIQK